MRIMAFIALWMLLGLSTWIGGTRESTLISDDIDTLRYNGYTIIKTSDAIDSSDYVYSVIIVKNNRIVWRLGQGVEERQDNIAGLIPFFNDTTRQLFIEQYSGGAHCCWSVFVLNLGSSIDTLYCSQDYEELGGEPDLIDLDNDGIREISQDITGFLYFDMISYAGSARPMAFFKYSNDAHRYVLANRTFAHLILKDVDTLMVQLKRLAGSVNPMKHSDYAEELRSTAFRLLLYYVYAGQRDEGWRIYDSFYVLKDKAGFRAKIEAALEESRIYRALYARGGGN